MNEEELIQFNPILAKALATVEQENNIVRNGPNGVLRGLVATCVKAGMPPEKIFAVIKTARVLTEQNLKFMSKQDIKEWEDACTEYNQLATSHRA